ncbi:MAG: phytoene/squalene synthase family protein [Gemmatimonadales bacterium]|nr:phytoene/squalene synthase family protein [Gemmatimonadales bacterium]
MSLALEESYARAERVTAEWAKSFHFASRFLPRHKRRGIFALYDYCRHADNLVDSRGSRPVELVRQDIAELGGVIRAMYAGVPPAEPRWLALHDTLGRHPVPMDPLLELLEGVAMDLEPVEIADAEELMRYCRFVAGGVGLMIGPILGVEHPDTFREAGVRLGIAMQLTNVLRDIGEDLDNDRVYLPAEELARFGLTRADLERREVTPVFRQFMEFQVARARRYFEQGSRVVPLFPNDGSRLTVRLLKQTYAGILDAIERLDYDVFRARAYVSMPRKLAMLGRAIWTERPWPAAGLSVRSA